MNFKIGDFVTRNSYNNDIVFRIVDIDGEKTNIELNKSNLEAVRKGILSSYPGAKQCLFIYEEKG